MVRDRAARERLYEFLHRPATKTAHTFDLFVTALIFVSVVVVVLESVPEIGGAHPRLFGALEWTITIAFTLDYVLRLYAAPSRRAYALSFFGIVDLVSTLPLYLAIFVPGAASVAVLRALRLIRLFRLFGRSRWADHGGLIWVAVRTSVPKIGLFIGAVTLVTVVLGAAMFLVEGPNAGFTSIPKGMYWAVATLTTVGYGDVVPTTVAGRTLAAVVMVLGYGVIAVPVGIVSSDIAQTVEAFRRRLECPECGARGHSPDSRYCRVCGGELVLGESQVSSGNWASTPKPTEPNRDVGAATDEAS